MGGVWNQLRQQALRLLLAENMPIEAIDIYIGVSEDHSHEL